MWLGLLASGLAVVAWAEPRSLERLEAERSALLARLHRAEDGAAELRALTERLGVLRARAAAELKEIPEDSGFASLMGSLGANFDALGVHEREITNGGPIAGEDARTLPMRVRLTADFPSVFATVHWIEGLPRLVRVQRVRIEAEDKKAPWSGRVKAELTLDVFFGPTGGGGAVSQAPEEEGAR